VRRHGSARVRRVRPQRERNATLAETRDTARVIPPRGRVKRERQTAVEQQAE